MNGTSVNMPVEVSAADYHSLEDVSFRLDVFEGPLDLLLALIAKNKVSLDDIPVAMILDQYLDCLDKMASRNLEITSEFIVMAAQLLVLKSKMLLPSPEAPEEDPRASLARRLAEYALIKKAAAAMSAAEKKTGIRFTKPPEPLPTREYAYTHEPELLKRLMTEIGAREKEIPQLPLLFRELVGKESDSIANAAERVLRLLKNARMTVTDILTACANRREAVVTFIALLELCHENRLTIDDEGMFGA